ncbi:FadR/GntR family transcriptional regulator [Companilactobacillus jidongensis]|uniref:FadR/GntR family transcriptional regulator n=1 Tax=Companilactobacillus jidongensis TaxID=2486006 RepID=UPI0013DE2711|nr:GntR family transcriptional regulator [Companilactobacillus jidongensis]
MKFETIQSKSEVDQLVDFFEKKILTGELKIGDKLPSERVMAQNFGVSRSVMNNGLKELARLGFIRVVPRQGNYIAKFNENGNLETFNIIINFNGGNYRPSLLRSIFHTRKLFEDDMIMECDTDTSFVKLNLLYDKFKKEINPNKKPELSFDFYHELAVSSGNLVYPLLILNFKSIYLTLGKWIVQAHDLKKIEMLRDDVVYYLNEREFEKAKDCNDKLIDFCLSKLLSDY